MREVKILRQQVKKYIDNADERTLKILYAMLEAGQETDWATQISKGEKRSLEEALKQAERNQVISHEEVMKKHKRWFKNSVDPQRLKNIRICY